MLSSNPVMATATHSRNKRLSVNIPDDTGDDVEARNKQLGETLETSWEKARTRFKAETKKDLGSFKTSKEGILGTLRDQYGGDNTDTRKRDNILGTVISILNGVELVAATAAQVGGMVFAPAQMCFNALDVLFSIPKAVRKYGEDLQQLFKDVSSYLNNFQIYNRIDRQSTLDAALLISNNEILVALVDLCVLAWRVMNSQFKTVLGNIFLKNDAIAAALGDFRDLVVKQNQLTGTVTLEAALKNQSISRQILQQGTPIASTHRMVKDLAAVNAENKNVKMDRDRLLKIDKRMGLNEDMVTRPIEELQPPIAEPFSETYDLMRESSDLKHWRDSADSKKPLYISGGIGTGKTYVISTLAQIIDDENKQLQIQQQDIKESGVKDARKVYWTYYSFGSTETINDHGQFNTPAHIALKVMAAQLARQDVRYAKILSEALDNMREVQQTLQELWTNLRLGDFSAPPNSVLYMFFDDVDQIKSSLQDLSKTAKASVKRKEPHVEGEPPRVRIIFTGKFETRRKLAIEKLPTIDLSEVNQPLIKKYVSNRLQNLKIFQDDDSISEERKETVLDIISEEAKGSFNVAETKIQILVKAVDQDEEYGVLKDSLKQDTLNSYADEGQKILNRLSQSTKLSARHKEQLRELLMWAVHAKRRPNLAEVEAALYLQHDVKSLEPLKRKIENRFEDALQIVETYIHPRYEIEEAVNNTFNTQDPETAAVPRNFPQVKIDISVDHASEPFMRQLIADIESRIADAKVNFSLQATGTIGTNRISFTRSEAEFTMATRLLRALNDDQTRSQVAALVKYATVYLPSHVETFSTYSKDNCLSEELGSVGKALINFLNDSESIASAWDLFPFDPHEWLSDTNIDAMRAVLVHDALQRQLDPIQRRWVQRNINSGAQYAAILGTVASTAASKWLQDKTYTVNATDCFLYIDKYLELMLRKDPQALGAREGDNSSAIASQTAPVPISNVVEILQSASQDEAQLLAGNFSKSSWDTRLIGFSILEVRCYCINLDISRSSIDLNDCLANESGKLKWVLHGGALSDAFDARLMDNGRVLEVELDDGAGGRTTSSIRLDERISNMDGTLVFLEVVSPLSERVKRAEDWSIKILGIKPDSLALTRIGQTLLGSDPETAIEYLQRVTPEPQDPWKAVGLGVAFASQEKFGTAIEHLEEALIAFELTKTGPDKEAEVCAGKSDCDRMSEVKDSFTCLQRIAEYQVIKQDVSAAISALEKALAYRPWASTCRWRLIELLCKDGRPARAEELLGDWESSSQQLGAESPAGFVRRKSAPGAFYDDFWPVLMVCRGTNLYDRIHQVMNDVIEEAERQQDEESMFLLFHRRAVLIAYNGGSGSPDAASQDHFKVLQVGHELESPGPQILYDAARLAVMHSFDKSRRQFSSLSTQAAAADAGHLIERLEADVAKAVALLEGSATELGQLHTYVAALAQMVGRVDHAKNVLRPMMADALDILCDDDIYNDDAGLILLFQALLYSGDIEGALTVWSLLDRHITRPLVEERSQAEANQPLPPPEDGPREEDTTTEKPEQGFHLTEASVGNSAASTEEDDNNEQMVGFTNNYFVYHCGLCDQGLVSWQDEQWWCRYCLKEVFCTGCKEEVVRDNRVYYVCNPEHEFVRIQHADYAREEIAGSNVRVGWHWEDVQQEDGQTKRERVGGDIIDVRDWLDMLRAQWAIEKLTVKTDLEDQGSA